MADVLPDSRPDPAVVAPAAAAGAGSALSPGALSRTSTLVAQNRAGGVGQALPSLVVRLVVEPQTALRTFTSDAQVTVTHLAGGGARMPLSRQGGAWVADLPRTAALYLVRATGPGTSMFAQEAQVAVTSAGVAVLHTPSPEVGPLIPVGGGGTPAFRLPVTLPRVRDVTAEAERRLGRPWQPPTRTVEILTDPLPAGRLHFTATAVTPARTQVFEIAHLDRPKLVSVTWPAGLTAGSPFRFLLFMHHRIGQNKEHYLGSDYPWGHVFLELGFHRYLDFAGSPLAGYGSGKGLAFQLAASGRNVAIVLPMPHHTPDNPIGELGNGTVLEVVLQEIAAHAARRMPGAPVPPLIDRLALASFSAADLDSATFLRNAAGYSFLRRTLREAYRFEGRNDQIWLGAVAAWARTVPASDPPRIRIYRQMNPTDIGAYRRRGFVMWPAAGDRTYAALNRLPIASSPWLAAGSTANLANWQEVEGMIANTMLVDALRRSAF